MMTSEYNSTTLVRWCLGLAGFGVPFLTRALPLDFEVLDLLHRFPVVVVLGFTAIGILFIRWSNYYFDDESRLRGQLYMLSLCIPHVAAAFVASCLLCVCDWWHGFALVQIYGAVFLGLWLDKRQITDMLTVPESSQPLAGQIQKSPSP